MIIGHCFHERMTAYRNWSASLIYRLKIASYNQDCDILAFNLWRLSAHHVKCTSLLLQFPLFSSCYSAFQVKNTLSKLKNNMYKYIWIKYSSLIKANAGQQGIENFRCDGIKQVANLTGRRNFMDAEDRLRVVSIAVLLHPLLIVWKRGGFARKRPRRRLARYRLGYRQK